MTDQTPAGQPATYRKKPVEIQAMQLDGTEQRMFDVLHWIDDEGGQAFGVGAELRIQTLEGVMEAKTNDFIVRGVAGEFYPVKCMVFAATYDEVPADRPTQPLADDPAPARGTGTTGPQGAADDVSPAAFAEAWATAARRTQERDQAERDLAAERERADKAEAEVARLRAKYEPDAEEVQRRAVTACRSRRSAKWPQRRDDTEEAHS